jgi:integrase
VGSKRVRKWVYGHTRAEVQRKLAAAQRSLEHGHVPDDRLTVGAFLSDWLVSVQPQVRPLTFVSYSGHVRLHLEPLLGRVPLMRLSTADVRRMVADRLRAGKAPRTVAYSLTVLRMALGQAVRDGLLVRNVAALVEAPRQDRREVVPLLPHQARAFMAAIRGHRLEALYTLTLAIGLRQGEALGLRWSDVDLETGNVTVSGVLQRVGGKWHRNEPKTEPSRRTVRVPAVAVAALREHRRRQIEERLAAGPRWRDRWGLVFTGPLGQELDPRAVTRGLQATLAGAGLPRQRFHDLRHGAATLMLAQGVPMRVVMETLGHSNMAMTANVYSHVVPALGEDAARRMDEALGGVG